MKEMMERLRENGRRMPILAVLAGLCLLGGVAYGGLITTGGVYGDDPNVLYAYHRLGNGGFDAFYGWARPFSTWVHKLVIPLTGIDMGRINTVTIALRVLSCWMLYLLVREMGEEAQETAWMAAVIALVYPGFGQQAQAVQFLLHFSVLTLVLFSLWAMARAVKAEERQARSAWMGAAILSACGQVSIEYFIGLELARPVLLAMMLQEREGKSLKGWRFWRYYAPFAVLLTGYLVWRVALFKPAYPQITILEELRIAPWETMGEVLARAGKDLVTVMAGAWEQMARVLGGTPISGWVLASGATGTVLALAGAMISEKEKADQGGEGMKRLFIVGGSTLVLGGVPLWASGTPLSVTHPWNRTTLCFLTGVSMVSAGALMLLARNLRRVLLAMLAGMAVVFQRQAGADYAREWVLVQDLFTQLTQQAPQLKEDTLVLYDDFPLRYYSANNLNALLNWTYDPERGAGDEKYKMFEIDERLSGALPALEPGAAVRHDSFRGSTSQAVVIALDENGKLMILDSEMTYMGPLAGRTQEAAHLSVPGDVIIFGENQAQFPEVLSR